MVKQVLAVDPSCDEAMGLLLEITKAESRGDGTGADDPAQASVSAGVNRQSGQEISALLFGLLLLFIGCICLSNAWEARTTGTYTVTSRLTGGTALALGLVLTIAGAGMTVFGISRMRAR
jgi:hypothetical protein